jgi:hypothetical protein
MVIKVSNAALLEEEEAMSDESVLFSGGGFANRAEN